MSFTFLPRIIAVENKRLFKIIRPVDPDTQAHDLQHTHAMHDLNPPILQRRITKHYRRVDLPIACLIDLASSAVPHDSAIDMNDLWGPCWKADQNRPYQGVSTLATARLPAPKTMESLKRGNRARPAGSWTPKLGGSTALSDPAAFWGVWVRFIFVAVVELGALRKLGVWVCSQGGEQFGDRLLSQRECEIESKHEVLQYQSPVERGIGVVKPVYSFSLVVVGRKTHGQQKNAYLLLTQYESVGSHFIKIIVKKVHLILHFALNHPPHTHLRPYNSASSSTPPTTPDHRNSNSPAAAAPPHTSAPYSPPNYCKCCYCCCCRYCCSACSPQAPDPTNPTSTAAPDPSTHPPVSLHPLSRPAV